MVATPDYLLEIDYTSYDVSCRDPLISGDDQLVLCRRLHGHTGDHATRAGIRAIVWGEMKEQG